MKSAVIDNRNVKIIDTNVPKVGKKDVLVKMRSCGICGSDVEKVFGNYGMKSSRIGHEPAGEIISIGDEIQDFKIGDRVFIHHHVPCYSCYYCYHDDFTMCERYQSSNIEPNGLSEYILVPDWNISKGGLVKLPENINYEQAALIEPIACCIRSLNKLNIANGDKIAILGAGPTGLMHMILSKLFGISQVILSDINDFRLDFAKKINPDVTTINLGSIDKNEFYNTVLMQTDGMGADISIICTSSLNAFIDAVTITRKGGTVSLFGVPAKGSDLKIDLNLVYSKEIKIIPSYATSEKEISQAINLIRNKVIDIENIITHKFDLSESLNALNHAHKGKDSMKVIIKSGQEQEQEEKIR
jgi:L-iditol 2-dehydrogenase